MSDIFHILLLPHTSHAHTYMHLLTVNNLKSLDLHCVEPKSVGQMVTHLTSFIFFQTQTYTHWSSRLCSLLPLLRAPPRNYAGPHRQHLEGAGGHAASQGLSLWISPLLSNHDQAGGHRRAKGKGWASGVEGGGYVIKDLWGASLPPQYTSV